MLFDMMTENKEKEEELGNNKSPNQVQKHDVNIVKSSNKTSINSLNIFDNKSIAAAENFLAKIVKSKKGGIESINDGLAVLMRAQDLNLPFSTCLEHIHVINGKTGIDIHIIKALMLRAGCKWECLKDYQPLYEYTDGINVYVDGKFPEYAVRCISKAEAEDKRKNDTENIYVYPVKWYKDFKGNMYRDYQLNNEHFSIVVNTAQASQIMKAGKVPVYRIPNNPVDYVTEYKITRNINGEIMQTISNFSLSDAITAELIDKDNYKHFPKVMIGHRAFVIGARDIASDVLFGVMETTELKSVMGKPITDEDLVYVEDSEIEEI